MAKIKITIRPIMLVNLFALVTIASCHTATAPASGEPIANAGPDLVTKAGMYVTLDGSQSRPGDGDTLIYRWSSDTANPSYVYVDSRSAMPQSAFSIPGTFRFELVVNDGLEESAPDVAVVTVMPRDYSMIEDVNLEISLRYALDLPNGEITLDMLLAVDTLYNYSGYHKISSLSGLDYCTNLVVLGLSDQNVSDVSPVSNLTKLEKLYLEQNRTLVDVTPLSHLIELSELNLQGNNISDISALRDLHLLHLGSDHVTDISVLANCTELERLYLDRNQIDDVSALQDLYNLNILDLKENRITDILPLVENNGLGQGDAVSLQGNPLDSISVNQYIPALRDRGVLVFY